MKDCTCLYVCPAASTRTINRGVRGGGMHMVSVFYGDTANTKARQTSTTTSIILAIPYGDRETMQASSAHTACPTPYDELNVVHSRLRSHQRRRFLQVHKLGEDGRFLAESLEDNGQNFCAKNMLSNSGDSTHPCRSPCSTSNHSEQTPSSGRTHALIPFWKIVR